MNIQSSILITPQHLAIDDIVIDGQGLNALYRAHIGDYPKFFKMDGLCKLGFIGAEFLLKSIPLEQKSTGAIILFNRSGSLTTDRNYQETICEDNYFPSPALFVYTLANIVTGEIAIRHKIYGETSFYIMDSPNEEEMTAIVSSTFQTSQPSFILTGWLEYNDDTDYMANMKLIIK